MATIVNATLDSPEAKIVQINIPENEAINTPSVLTFAGAGLTNLNAAPVEYYANDITVTGQDTVTCTFSLTAVTALGFTVTKTAVAGGGGALQRRFMIYFHTRPFYA
jgi:hypothetical protein